MRFNVKDDFVKVRVADDGSDDRLVNPLHIVEVKPERDAISRVVLSNGTQVIGTIVTDEPAESVAGDAPTA